MRTSLRPVMGAFAVFGTFAGAWAVEVVDVERSFDVSDGQIGVMLAIGILAGTIVAAIGGALMDRWGAGAALTTTLLGWAAALALAGVAPHFALFALAFTLAMGVGGAVDVVMNVIAADALSTEPGRLVRFHGLFNGGAVIGALVAGLVLHAGGSWRVVWLVIAGAAFVLAFVVRRVPVPQPPAHSHPSVWRALASLRHEGLFVLAIVFSAAAMVEGGIATWGILYLRDDLGLGVLAGVGAYVVGQSLATAARIGGGPLIGVVGAPRSLRIGGALAAAGIAAEALSHHAAVAATGLALATVGISVVWPLLLATVNNEAKHPAVAIGGVTAAGYLGMVAGPPIVGLLSSVFGLQVGLLVLSGTALFVALTPAHVRRRADADAQLAPADPSAKLES